MTLGFATTQDMVHISSIHVTTASVCYVVVIDVLPDAQTIISCTPVIQLIGWRVFMPVCMLIIKHVKHFQPYNSQCGCQSCHNKAIAMSGERTIATYTLATATVFSKATRSRESITLWKRLHAWQHSKYCRRTKLRYKDGKGDPKWMMKG